MNAADRDVVDRWWRVFVATGALPDELASVQGRLIRAVHRGALPSGPVHVKSMTFPRLKDRLRYLLRALPGAHEAAMLRRVRAASVPCPEVLAVRTLRRGPWPHRSLLVLRSLPVVPEAATAERRIADEVRLAARLLAAGIVHRDLHGENFVRLADGALAVLDLQSASRSASARRGAAGPRLAVAARLVRDRQGPVREAGLAAMVEVGLLRDETELHAVRLRWALDEARYRRSRLHRCLTDSTGFERRVRWGGVEYRVRGDERPGRWWRPRRGGARSLRRAWLGQRQLQLDHGRPLPFLAFFRKWWWLGGGGALYVPRACSDAEVEAEVRTASTAIPGRSSEVAPDAAAETREER